MKARKSVGKRKTKETDILVEVNLDGTGKYSVDTGIGFLDHMLELWSKHSLIDLKLKARGDLKVDYHHTVEDVGLVLGEALNQALGDRKGIRRYGWSYMPMDDTLSRVVVDLGGRPYLVYDISNPKKKIRDFDVGLIEEFFRALVTQARMNLHIAQLYGKDVHHAYESVFKGLAKAMRMASERDPRATGVPSSKGVL
ncbi:MAG: imidazoleglycerol-phosphate dehydratase HisB [Kiritimatiellia bacterium]